MTAGELMGLLAKVDPDTPVYVKEPGFIPILNTWLGSKPHIVIGWSGNEMEPV